MKIFLTAAALILTLNFISTTDPDLHPPDPHESKNLEDVDVLPRDPNYPPPDCRLYPVRPGYFQCRRSLLRCMDQDSNICHDHCHVLCRDVCYRDFDKCIVRAREQQNIEVELGCLAREDECYGRCMQTCKKDCQPCRDMFHNCRRCVSDYEDSLRSDVVEDDHE